LILLVFAVMSFVVMRLFVLDLVDEVWDGGWELVVRNRGREARIPLTEIINVNYDRFSNPPRVTLMLRDPCEFGSEIAFMVRQRMFVLGNPARRVALDLIGRIDAARLAQQYEPDPMEDGEPEEAE